jgi:hypothetical protein
VNEGAPTKRATILAVVEGAADLERVKEVLRRRYAADYEISCTSSLARAERELRRSAPRGSKSPSCWWSNRARRPTCLPASTW